ncbi:MAG: tetratricopeptide repeat protein [Myxococcota bacterium]|nr:tetratricopeptide repeat protein [Myxococcota bacterium]
MSAPTRSKPSSPRAAFALKSLALPALVGLLMGQLLVTGCRVNTESQLAEVRALQQAGQYDASIAPLRKLLAHDSGHAEANLRLGIALRQTGRPSLAVWPLQKASTSDAYRIEAGLLLAGTLSASGSTLEAIRAYNRVLESDPGNSAALYGRGRAELGTGQPAQALATAKELLAVRPDDQSATLLEASALVDLERGDEAEDAIKGLAQRAAQLGNPADAGRKCAALGLFYRSQENKERARETFARCVSDYPRHAQLRQHASDFFLDIDEPEITVEIWRSTVAATPEDLGLRTRLAEILSSLGNDEDALEVLQESVELFDSPEAWRILSGYQRTRGNMAGAREALEESFERSRTVAPSLKFTLADILIEEGNLERAAEIGESLEEPSYRAMIQGAILLKQGKPAEALDTLAAGLELYPNNAGARYLAGSAALGADQPDRAMAEFREAIRIKENDTDAALRLAELYFTRGDYSAAVQFAKRQIAHRPLDGPTAHLIAARSLIFLGRYKNAEEALDSLRSKAPGEPAVYLELADLKRRLEGDEAALELLSEGEFDITLPANEAILRSMTQSQLALGRGNEALQAAETALAAHPDVVGFHDVRGRILLGLGQKTEAAEAFSRALELDSEHPAALEGQGSMALGAGDLAAARAYFARATEADPANAEYLYLQAQTHYMDSNLAEADDFFRQAIEANRAHVGANNDLAWLLASQGQNLEEALEFASRAARIGNNADTLDTLGFVHLQAGNAEEAVKILGRALELRPDSASIQFRLGVALGADGNLEAAEEMLGKALRTPNFPEAEEARAELAKLQKF